jgi:hypothetical protein
MKNADIETSESIKNDILKLLKKYEVIRLMYTNPFLKESIVHLQEIQHVCQELVKKIERTLVISDLR